MNKVNHSETIGDERTRVEEINTDFPIELRIKKSEFCFNIKAAYHV